MIPKAFENIPIDSQKKFFEHPGGGKENAKDRLSIFLIHKKLFTLLSNIA